MADKKKSEKGLGSLYKPHTALLKHREWRGFKDTAYDYFRWLITCKDIIKMTLKAPISTVKGIWRYRWMASYLSAPSFIDRHTAGLRGTHLRITHIHFNLIIKHTTDLINTSLVADEYLNPGNKKAKKIILTDEIVPNEVFMGFPNLTVVPLSTIPIFLTSMVDQLITPFYLEETESFGVPADVCPLPSGEAGVAIVDDYPKIGCCMISSNMPCDGSVINSTFIDRRLKLPVHVFNTPLRYNGEDVQEYAVDEIKDLINFIEKQTGEKFDWDAYFSAMKTFNQQTEFELQKWEINRTPYPQMTGAAFWLYRIYYFNLSGGTDKRFLEADKKVNKLMMKGYQNKEPVSNEMRHRTIVWSCPANYYTNFANWLENCWGMNVVMDMETMISYQLFDTEDKEQSLKDLAKAYQRSIMRKHTKGGYANVLNELWRIVEEFNADTVIMYDQISCKGMDGLTGIFDDQAREHNVNFIWVKQDLMDPRTISRRDMRQQVNQYMQTVLQEDPVDPTLLDFEDDLAW